LAGRTAEVSKSVRPLEASDAGLKSIRQEPRKKQKAAVTVAAELRRQIATGMLKPGDKLHPESVLQTEFSISRPTLREALRVLESESLITIRRGKHGGASVSSVDLGPVANQVGVFLQIEGTTLQDVWFARTAIEPPAARLLAESGNEDAFREMEFNIAAARDASKHDLIRYADLSAEFSLLLTRHSGNKTIHMLASLIYNIIRRQHEDVTERTINRASVNELRQASIRDRELIISLMRRRVPEVAESFWRAHLARMRDLVLPVYKGTMTINALHEHTLAPPKLVKP
jgi:DNA-binding FadR family transcriptional regulator